MKPRSTRTSHNPSEMTSREIRQANNLHRRLRTALEKDRAGRDY